MHEKAAGVVSEVSKGGAVSCRFCQESACLTMHKTSSSKTFTACSYVMKVCSPNPGSAAGAQRPAGVEIHDRDNLLPLASAQAFEVFTAS